MPVQRIKGSAAVAETPTKTRHDELRRMLIARQREILNEVQTKIRTVRADGPAIDREILEQGGSEVDLQEDIEFALIQMKVETLNKISEALVHIQDGTYGRCFECEEEISEVRLRAIPFAVRCKDCEEAREMARRRGRIRAPGGPSSLDLDMRMRLR